MAPFLHRLAKHGVPAPNSALPWTLHMQDKAAHCGPHPSAAHTHTSFLLEDMHEMVKMGFWVVLPYSAVQDRPHLKIAPAGVIPQ